MNNFEMIDSIKFVEIQSVNPLNMYIRSKLLNAKDFRR
jgi:hypothetical protein